MAAAFPIPREAPVTSAIGRSSAIAGTYTGRFCRPSFTLGGRRRAHSPSDASQV
jgi:hypothetical protein